MVSACSGYPGGMEGVAEGDDGNNGRASPVGAKHQPGAGPGAAVVPLMLGVFSVIAGETVHVARPIGRSATRF